MADRLYQRRYGVQAALDPAPSAAPTPQPGHTDQAAADTRAVITYAFWEIQCYYNSSKSSANVARRWRRSSSSRDEQSCEKKKKKKKKKKKEEEEDDDHESPLPPASPRPRPAPLPAVLLPRGAADGARLSDEAAPPLPLTQQRNTDLGSQRGHSVELFAIEALDGHWEFHLNTRLYPFVIALI
ncbi:Protein of unknown function [Gryllus bimaculatus]|nr:Protein of unknown function [Gryllus bimaculatus]